MYIFSSKTIFELITCNNMQYSMKTISTAVWYLQFEQLGDTIILISKSPWISYEANTQTEKAH